MCQPTGLASATATYYKVSLGGPPIGGQCLASPAMPTGEAYGVDPTVVCCLQ
jgi:hypothetical protein